MGFLGKMVLVLAFSSVTVVSQVRAEDAPAGPSDPQIAHIAVTANQVDADAALVALKISKNKEIRAFAEMMKKDHINVKDQAMALAKKLNVKPEDNDTSKGLKSGGDQNLKNLGTLKGKEFDKHYIDHEVEYHEAVISAIEKILVPNSKNAELKKLLESIVAPLKAHLEHAKKVQAAVSKG
jgi:putative membrane protein